MLLLLFVQERHFGHTQLGTAVGIERCILGCAERDIALRCAVGNRIIAVGILPVGAAELGAQGEARRLGGEGDVVARLFTSKSLSAKP